MLDILAAVLALSVDSVTVRETNFDTVAVVTATLAAPSSEPVSVPYATSDGTADSTDYVATSGALTFPPGQTQARLPVLIKGDALDEADETFFVDVDGARGSVTIVDDVRDRLPVRVLDAAISARWKVRRTYTQVSALRVRAPSIARIDVACAGRGCPFRFATSTRRLVGAKLGPGTRVQITVDAPGQIGKRFRYTMRAGKPPLRTVAALD